MTVPVQPRRKAGRPRSAQSHQAILEATLEALKEEGFTAMSIERIALRAHVGKATIYRRWASKEELAIEALSSLQAEIPLIDTGNLRYDLLTGLEKALQVAQQHPHTEQLALKLVGEISTNPEVFRMFVTRVIMPRLQQMTVWIERAKGRGEVRPEIDPLFVFSMVASSLFYHLLVLDGVTEETVTPPTPEQIVDIVLRGIGVPGA